MPQFKHKVTPKSNIRFPTITPTLCQSLTPSITAPRKYSWRSVLALHTLTTTGGSRSFHKSHLVLSTHDIALNVEFLVHWEQLLFDKFSSGFNPCTLLLNLEREGALLCRSDARNEQTEIRDTERQQIVDN